MTILTPIILGLLIISAGSGLIYLAMQIQTILNWTGFTKRFIGEQMPSYIGNIHLVSITTAIILMVLELFL